MAPPLRTFSLIKLVKFIIDSKIPGDFVECGVWRGGSSMAIAKTLYDLGVSNRKIYLYDTFQGMTEAGNLDVSLQTSENYNEMKSNVEFNRDSHVWAYASISEVKKNMLKTKFPPNLTVFIEGDVKSTLSDHLPDKIALLRLDTDFYESTAIELEALYPQVTVGGGIFIDDYGSWAGSQIATDEYRKKNRIKSYLHIIDNDARIFFKV
jgi:O-methyltransferase